MARLNEYGLTPEALATLDGCSVYIIGDTDTGKSTLAGLLARRLGAALVDLDAGQASVGLPTTFAWRAAGERRPRGMYFTGTTSPSGFYDLSVAGSAAMVSEARAFAPNVVVDSCGLARGDAGRQLHHTTVEAIRPDIVLAIQREDELAELIEPLAVAGWPRVIRATAPASARTRSRATRRSYRRSRFRDYFAGARERELCLGQVAVLRPKPDPVGRIASLRDTSGRDIALALVRSYRPARGTMTVLTPAPRGHEITAVVLGSMRIARDGRQLARNV
jgi:polynucleotide 5'-hydroxyl-kinase GRC3/NOL9